MFGHEIAIDKKAQSRRAKIPKGKQRFIYTKCSSDFPIGYLGHYPIHVSPFNIWDASSAM
jgi:hypothetical protein